MMLTLLTVINACVLQAEALVLVYKSILRPAAHGEPASLFQINPLLEAVCHWQTQVLALAQEQDFQSRSPQVTKIDLTFG